MTPRQIELVQQTWKKIALIQDDAAALFYKRLFELDPALRSLFKGDIEQQGRKLMATLNGVVLNLENHSLFLQALEECGRRHIGYGVKPEDYDTVGAALLWMLEKVLGEAFTDETKGAWADAYAILSEIMQNAAAASLQQSSTA